ncbi:hypothetical protein E2L06_07350 [Haloterrigena sp. H1]|uniref:DUF7511 domain-containing protein n=1 Tax=Haloterrigena sp. H1 TaxID=2552943 RepID=UPI00110E908A|nr:hypothetical protein [Haloterrigena sp. H1]TMT86423.1 hypothetical protein E2L06_07350 [Haloterrigena sp. H1]
MHDSQMGVTPESTTERTSSLQHITVEQDDVAVCTMFPQYADENAAATQWITATADSFVSLEARQ